MELKEQFEQLAADKRAEIAAVEGTIAETKESLSRLTAENKAREQMAVEFEKLAASYAKKQ